MRPPQVTGATGWSLIALLTAIFVTIVGGGHYLVIAVAILLVLWLSGTIVACVIAQHRRAAANTHLAHAGRLAVGSVSPHHLRRPRASAGTSR